MKLHALLNSRNAAAFPATNKSIQPRPSAAKQAAHRYERRKMREFLRHSLDTEDESSRFVRFG